MAQSVRNPPAVEETVLQETQVESLGWEDSLEEEMATHFSILAWEIPWTLDLAGYNPRHHKSWTRLSN